MNPLTPIITAGEIVVTIVWSAPWHRNNHGAGSSTVEVSPKLYKEHDRHSYITLPGEWSDKVGSVVVIRPGRYGWEVVTEEDE